MTQDLGVENHDLDARGMEMSATRAWSMLESAPDAMLLTDREGIILVANRQVELLFGHDRSTLIGQPVEMLIPADRRNVHRGHRARFGAEPSVRAMGTGLDLRAVRADGTEFHVEISLSPIRDDDGLAVVASIRDMTERRAVERRIATSEELLRTAFDHGSAGMAVIGLGPDGDRTIQRVNASMCALLDRTEAELLGTELAAHTHPEDRRADQIGIERLAAHVHDRYEGERRYRRADGSYVWALLQASVVELDGEAIMLAQIVDLTERREVQRERDRVRMLEDRERIGRDLHDVVIQRLFAAGMELQSIAPSLGATEAVDVVQHTIDELDATIRELRSAIFGLSNTRRPASMADELDAAIQDQIGALGLTPRLEIDGDIESVPAVVAEQLIPSVREALTNVAKHANATSVVVRIVVSGSELIMQVDDDGEGVVDATVRGHGLDNLLARAERLSGHCVLEPRPEGGSRLLWAVTI
jgi:PAS domain S-box-containing protein